MLNGWFYHLNDSRFLYKLTVSILLLVLIPLFISNLLNVVSISKYLRGGILDQLTDLRDSKKEKIEIFFKERYRDINGLRRTIEVRDGLVGFSAAFDDGFDSISYSDVEAQYGHFFGYFITEYPYYDLILINTNGDVVYTYAKGEDLGTNMLNPAYSQSGLAQAFQQGLKEMTLVDYQYYPPSKKYVSFISAPVYDLENEVIGVIVLQLSLQAINDAMNKFEFSETGVLYLVGSDGQLRSKISHAPETPGRVKVNQKIVQMAFAGDQDIMTSESFQKRKVFSAYAPLEIKGLDWVIIAEIERKEIYSLIYSLIGKILLQAGIFVLLVLIIVFLSTKWITNPIYKGVAFLKRLADRGDYLSNVSIVVTDPDGYCVFADQMANQTTGLAPGIDTREKPIGSMIIEAIEEKKIIRKIEQVQSDKERTYIDFSAFPIISNEKIVGGIGVGIDISEKVLLKHKLIDSERVFIMGEMTGRVIHDIRNLLQLIKMSGQMMEIHNQKGTLSKEKIHDSLTTIDTTLNNVTELLNDLLQFSKPEECKKQRIHLEEFFEQQIKIYGSSLQKNQINYQLDFAEDLWIFADPKLMRQAVINLIQNAIDVLQSFQGQRLLKLKGKFDQGQILLEIFNTGPTIPEEYQDQIFEAYFTTKGQSGTGLGLATTKEIIEDVYGGKIWFISSVEIGGTVFFIQLPESSEEEAVSWNK